MTQEKLEKAKYASSSSRTPAMDVAAVAPMRSGPPASMFPVPGRDIPPMQADPRFVAEQRMHMEPRAPHVDPRSVPFDPRVLPVETRAVGADPRIAAGDPRAAVYEQREVKDEYGAPTGDPRGSVYEFGQAPNVDPRLHPANDPRGLLPLPGDNRAPPPSDPRDPRYARPRDDRGLRPDDMAIFSSVLE